MFACQFASADSNLDSDGFVYLFKYLNIPSNKLHYMIDLMVEKS